MNKTDDPGARELARAAELARLAASPGRRPGAVVVPLRPAAARTNVCTAPPQAGPAEAASTTDARRSGDDGPHSWAHAALAAVATHAAEVARLVAAQRLDLIDCAASVARILMATAEVGHRRAGGQAQACIGLESLLGPWAQPTKAERGPAVRSAAARRARKPAAAPPPDRGAPAQLLAEVFAGLAQRAGLLLELVAQAQEGAPHAPQSALVMAQAIGAEADLVLHALGGVPVHSSEPARWLFGETTAALQARAEEQPAAGSQPGEMV